MNSGRRPILEAGRHLIKHNDADGCVGFQLIKFGCGLNAGMGGSARSIVFEGVNRLEDIILVDPKIASGKTVYNRAIFVRDHYIKHNEIRIYLEFRQIGSLGRLRCSLDGRLLR